MQATSLTGIKNVLNQLCNKTVSIYYRNCISIEMVIEKLDFSETDWGEFILGEVEEENASIRINTEEIKDLSYDENIIEFGGQITIIFKNSELLITYDK